MSETGREKPSEPSVVRSTPCDVIPSPMVVRLTFSAGVAQLRTYAAGPGEQEAFVGETAPAWCSAPTGLLYVGEGRWTRPGGGGPRARAAVCCPGPANAVSDGPLVAADEWFAHQIVETQAFVAQSDRSWTEKVCAMTAARDGSLQAGFGVGKYTNRGVFDGYASVSRGKQQWTVRASRRLSDDPGLLGAGPLALRHRRTAVDHPLHLRRQRRGPYRLRLDLHRRRAAGARGARPLPRAGRLPARHRAPALPPDRSRRGLDRGRGRAHRDHRGRLVRHSRSLLGRAPRRGSAADGSRAVATASGQACSFNSRGHRCCSQRPDGSHYAMHHQYRATSAFGYEERRFEGTVECTRTARSST